MTPYSLTLTEDQHDKLKRHLFSGDGLETAAILICRRVGMDHERFVTWRTLLVPHDACKVRTPVSITWPGLWIEKAIDLADAENDAIFLVHSHPGGVLEFSPIDGRSDQETIPALHAGMDVNSILHGSAIMTSNGAMRARVYGKDDPCSPVQRVMRVGHDIINLTSGCEGTGLPFGAEMRSMVRKRTACVIGISGTGSIVAELLARKDVGHLILIDFDIVKDKNLNRIVNSKRVDAKQASLKTAMMAAAIALYNPDIRVTGVSTTIADRNAIIAASSADVLFSCVDSMEGRHIAERIASACLIPLIDMGVTIPTHLDRDGRRQIADIVGRIDYVRPGGPSLSDRGVVTPEGLRREYLMTHAPNAAAEEVRAGYMRGVHEEAPSVMSLNMRAASTAVNEWLARMYGFRQEGNAPYARTVFSISACEEDYDDESAFHHGSIDLLGQGLVEPFLGLPGLAKPRRKDAA